MYYLLYFLIDGGDDTVAALGSSESKESSIQGHLRMMTEFYIVINSILYHSCYKHKILSLGKYSFFYSPSLTRYQLNAYQSIN